MSTATINRIKQYVRQPNPTTQHDTAAMYGNIVLTAMETMRGLMCGFDNELAFKAASAVLELQKARLRHKMPVAGVQQYQPTEQIEQPINDAPPSELTETQMKQFEKGVDEFRVVLNKKQAEDGQQEFPRAVLREQCWIKMKALGFDGFLDWVDLMVGRTDAVPAPGQSRNRQVELQDCAA
jgi:hypothetical protein